MGRPSISATEREIDTTTLPLRLDDQRIKIWHRFIGGRALSPICSNSSFDDVPSRFAGIAMYFLYQSVSINLQQSCRWECFIVHRQSALIDFSLCLGISVCVSAFDPQH